MRPEDRPQETVGIDDESGPTASLRSFTLTVTSMTMPRSFSGGCSLGSHPSNDLVIDDPTVSRFHCELAIDGSEARVTDLDSRNGTVIDGVKVKEGFLKTGSILRLGNVSVRFDVLPTTKRVALSRRTSFGDLVGGSARMRSLYTLLERAAATDSTVLLQGETGTGKTSAALAIHHAGARADRRFIVVDCASIPATLLESELFGHERGAFTGAHERRLGAFEEAEGGTVFIDEIGDLPLELQPKLLRVLENREVRRIGQNGWQAVDVRIIAATHTNLRASVNRKRFRSDLYYRLAVLTIPLPSLREVTEDLPDIARKLLGTLRAKPEQVASLLTPPFLASLERASWPGNVRELRNHLEEQLVWADPAEPGEAGTPGGETDELEPLPAGAIDPNVPFTEARRRNIDAFERAYVRELLRFHRGKVSEAARAAGIGRVHLHRLVRKHGIR